MKIDNDEEKSKRNRRQTGGKGKQMKIKGKVRETGIKQKRIEWKIYKNEMKSKRNRWETREQGKRD